MSIELKLYGDIDKLVLEPKRQTLQVFDSNDDDVLIQTPLSKSQFVALKKAFTSLEAEAVDNSFEYFQKKYPALYGTTEPECGFYLPKGWVGLVEHLSEELCVLQNRHDINLKVEQVKNKFGGLRFYFFMSSKKDRSIRDEITSTVAHYEFASKLICSECGGSYRRVEQQVGPHSRVISQCQSCHYTNT